MVIEPVLILVGTLVACAFLLLGIMELVWPTARRSRRRRRVSFRDRLGGDTLLYPIPATARASRIDGGTDPPVEGPHGGAPLAPRTSMEETGPAASETPSVLGGGVDRNVDQDVSLAGSAGSECPVSEPEGDQAVVAPRAPDEMTEADTGEDPAIEVSPAPDTEAIGGVHDLGASPDTPLTAADFASVFDEAVAAEERRSAGAASASSDDVGETEPHGDGATQAAPAAAQSLVDRCRTLSELGRLDEMLSVATAALAAPEVAATDATTIWRLVAGARNALGDRDGTLAAWDRALATAPDDARDACRREFATFALDRSRELMAQAGDRSDDDAFAAVRAARALLASAVERQPGDAGVGVALADVRARYWTACEARVHRLHAADRAADACRLAMDVLADVSLPDARRAAFDELRMDAIVAQISALTAEALASMAAGRDGEAADALDRAEALARSAGGLDADAQERVNRQLGWAYTKLGVQRADGDDLDGAVDPLFRALRLTPRAAVGSDETRAVAVRVLGALVQRRDEAIRDAAAVDRHAARTQAERLSLLVAKALGLGVPEAALEPARATVRALLESLAGS